jgi:hypothetical protein
LDAANAKSRDNGAIMGVPSGFSNSQNRFNGVGHPLQEFT